MKLYKKENWVGFAALSIFSMALFFSCQKEEGPSGLGNSFPKAALVTNIDADGHHVTIINKSTNTTFIPYWEVPDLKLGYTDLKGDTLKLNFVFAGKHRIRLFVLGKSGSDTTSVTVTTTPDLSACSPSTAFGFVASCTSKTWKLLPAAGAYKVGPAANDGSWWTNSGTDVSDRSCEFDDEYIFSFNAAGTFVYKSHGDFYGDGYMGDTSISGCQPESNFTPTQAPWGSGTFSFAAIEGTGYAGLGQIKVIGPGAHMGLQKVTTNAEVTSGPVSSITYDILSMTQDPGGDILVLGANMGWGWWTFTFKSI